MGIPPKDAGLGGQNLTTQKPEEENDDNVDSTKPSEGV